MYILDGTIKKLGFDPTLNRGGLGTNTQIDHHGSLAALNADGLNVNLSQYFVFSIFYNHFF